MAGSHVVNTKEKVTTAQDTKKGETKTKKEEGKKEKTSLGFFGRRFRSKANLVAGTNSTVDQAAAEPGGASGGIFVIASDVVFKPQAPIPEEPQQSTIAEPTPTCNDSPTFPLRIQSIAHSETTPTLNREFQFPLPPRMAQRTPGPDMSEAFASRPLTQGFSQYALHHAQLSTSSVHSIGNPTASAVQVDASVMRVDPNRPRHAKIDLSPGAKLDFPDPPKLADDPLISSHFNQLLAKNPAFNLDINFLKKSIYEHEAEAAETNKARLQIAFEYAKKVYANYLEAQKERIALKDSVRTGLLRYMAANDVAYKASVQTREDRAHIARMEKDIERLVKSNDDLAARKKNLSSDCARVKIDNQLLESKLKTTIYEWQLKVNELAQSKRELEATRATLNHARMQLHNLGVDGALGTSRSEGTDDDDDDMQYLCNKLKQKNDRLNDLEDELFEMRSNYWQTDRLYQYFRAAFVKMDELCIVLHHEIDQIGLKVTAAGSTGAHVNRLNENQVAEIQTSIISKYYPISLAWIEANANMTTEYGIGALRAYYSSVQEKPLGKPEPMLGAEFLNWIEQTFADLIERNARAIGPTTDDTDHLHPVPNDSGYIGGSLSSADCERLGQYYAAYNGESSQSMPRPVSEASLIDLDYACPDTPRDDSPTMGLGHYRGY